MNVIQGRDAFSDLSRNVDFKRMKLYFFFQTYYGIFLNILTLHQCLMRSYLLHNVLLTDLQTKSIVFPKSRTKFHTSLNISGQWEQEIAHFWNICFNLTEKKGSTGLLLDRKSTWFFWGTGYKWGDWKRGHKSYQGCSCHYSFLFCTSDLRKSAFLTYGRCSFWSGGTAFIKQCKTFWSEK